MKHQPVLYATACAGVLAAAALFPGCGRGSTDEPPATHAASESTAKRYPLRGVVVSVDAAKQTMLVQHEEIPGFMAAMTMSFPADAAVLAKVKPGQAITATLVHQGSKFWLEDIQDAAAATATGAPK